MMKTTESIKMKFWCYFTKHGFVKATKTKGAVKSNEIQIELQIVIPSKAFKETMYKAKLEITEDQLPDVIHEFEMKLIAIKKADEEK